MISDTGAKGESHDASGGWPCLIENKETPAGLRIGRSRPFGDRAPILVGGSPSIGDWDRVPPNAGI